MSLGVPGERGEGPVHFPPAAGFWLRATGWVLDLLWIGPAGWLSWKWLGSGTLGDRLGRESLAVVLGGVLAVAIATMWRAWGATPGKAVLGLRILGADGFPLRGGQVLLRGVGYLVSLLPFGLGFVMVGLNASRRGLHDQLSGTYVAEVRRGRGGRRRGRTPGGSGVETKVEGHQPPRATG